MTTPDIAAVSNVSTSETDTQLVTDNSQISNVTSISTNSTSPEVPHTEEVSKRLSALISSVRQKLKPGLDKSLQAELAALLNLLPELDNSYHVRLIPLVEIAVQSLLSEKPNLPLAEGIRKGIEKNVQRSPLAMIVRGGSPPARVIRGLGTLLIVFPLIALAAVLLRLVPGLLAEYEILLGPNAKLVWLVALAGAVGSVVSIMVRIQEYEPLTNTDPTILFLIGFFKPIVGIAFALFVFATLNSGLIPVAVDSTLAEAVYFYTALAFVSGFSERYAKDIAARAEETFVAGQASNR
jgi:hypothetical protein